MGKNKKHGAKEANTESTETVIEVGDVEVNNVLNTLAKNLMGGVPNDMHGKTDNFIKEVSKTVKSVLAESEKLVEVAENKIEAIEARTADGKTVEDERFTLKEDSNVEGTWQALYRVSDPLKSLYCIRHKSSPEPTFCGAHCAGFKILDNGNVEICTGSVRTIIKE